MQYKYIAHTQKSFLWWHIPHIMTTDCPGAKRRTSDKRFHFSFTNTYNNDTNTVSIIIKDYTFLSKHGDKIYIQQQWQRATLFITYRYTTHIVTTKMTQDYMILSNHWHKTHKTRQVYTQQWVIDLKRRRRRQPRWHKTVLFYHITDIKHHILFENHIKNLMEICCTSGIYYY